MGTDNLFSKKRASRKKREEAVRKQRKIQWLIMCEGEKTEPAYFRGLVDSLNLSSNIELEIKTCGEGFNTTSLVKRVEHYFAYCDKHCGVKRIPYEKIIFVFDRDSFGAKDFNNAINMAQNYSGSIVAWSNESFELWLCLHFHYIQSALSRNAYNDILTDLFRSKGIFTDKEKYDPDGKKDPALFYTIMEAGGSLKSAIRNAKKLAKEKDLTNPAKANPATMVFRVAEILIIESEQSIT